MAPLTSSAINKSKTVAPKAIARRRPAAPPPKPQAAPKSPPAHSRPEEDVAAGAPQTQSQSQAAPAETAPALQTDNDGPFSRSTAPADDVTSISQPASVEQVLPTLPPTQQLEKALTSPANTTDHNSQNESASHVDPGTIALSSSSAVTPTPATNQEIPSPPSTQTQTPTQPEPIANTSTQGAEADVQRERETSSISERPVTTGAARPTSTDRETPDRDASEAVPVQTSASSRVPTPSPVAGVKRKRGAPKAAQSSSIDVGSTEEPVQVGATSNETNETPEDSPHVASGDQQTAEGQQVSEDQQIDPALDNAAQNPTKPRAKRQKKAATSTQTTDEQPNPEGQSDAVTPSVPAKPKAKPRAKRKPKSAARIVEDEDGNVIDEPEPAPAKEKPARKPRQRKPRKTTEEAAAAPEGSELENPELHEIDVTVTTMSHLTRDRKVGKTSEREVKMAAIDWPEVIRKRIEAADAIARGAGAVAEPEGGDKPTEGGEGADEGERDAETPGPRAAVSGPRLRLDADGNLVVDETSLRIDRQAQAEANAANLQVTEEDDLTQRVNRMSWISARKKEPTERLPFFKMKSDPWSDEETDRFYEALRMFGTDFFIISKMFVPKTRRQIKLKFIREERLDADRVNRALAGENTAMSLEHFAEATGQDIDNFKDPRILEEELRVEGEEQREEIALKKKEIEEAKKQRDVQIAAREKDTAKRQAQKKQKAQARANRRHGVFGTGTF